MNYRVGRVCQEADPKTDAVWTICCADRCWSTEGSCWKVSVNGTVDAVCIFMLL